MARQILLWTAVAMALALPSQVSAQDNVSRAEFNQLRGQVEEVRGVLQEITPLLRETAYALRNQQQGAPVRFASYSPQETRQVIEDVTPTYSTNGETARMRMDFVRSAGMMAVQEGGNGFVWGGNQNRPTGPSVKNVSMTRFTDDNPPVFDDSPLSGRIDWRTYGHSRIRVNLEGGGFIDVGAGNGASSPRPVAPSPTIQSAAYRR